MTRVANTFDLDRLPKVWIPDADWTVLDADEARGCAFGRCTAPAIARLYRRHKGGLPRGYPYCQDHLYGREIIRGVVHVQVAADCLAARRGYSLLISKGSP